MNSLEQYLKPPTNNKEEEIYNEDGEKGEDENEYIENQENGNDNGENIDFTINQKGENIQDSKKIKILQNNLNYGDEYNDIIQGINSINNVENKNLNMNMNINDEENQIENEENNKNEKNEYQYINQNFLNINENSNNDINSKDELMNELLFKIQKIKEKRAKNNNKVANDTNKLDKINNKDNLINLGLEKTKIKKYKYEYNAKLNLNNQVFNKNPKMKELVNLIKDYTRDKNENDKMQINFDNNNQINILKPEAFFNNHNTKNVNANSYDKDYKGKYYISVIDGKAIVNGQRIDVNRGFQLADNNLNNKKINNNDYNNNKNYLFDFNTNKFLDKKNKFNNSNQIWNIGNNLDLKLNNLNFVNNNEKSKILNNENNNKIEFKKINKNNFLSKDFYKEELDKINNSLFNIDRNLKKLKK